MFKIMLQKIWHKKWMNLCLLLGSVLLIATVVSFPLYQTAAYDGMLQEEFRNYVASEGKWPTFLSMVMVSKNDIGGGGITRAESFTESVASDLDVTPKENIYYFTLGNREVHSAMNRDAVSGLSLFLGTMSNLPAHAKMLSGEMYSETGLTEDGSIEVVVSQTALVDMNLLVGETIVFNDMKDAQNNEIRMYIKGVFGMESSTDFYWQINPDDMNKVCLMNTDLFRQMFTGDNAGKYSITCNYYSMFEYADIKASQVEHLMERTDYFMEEGSYRKVLKDPAYRDILAKYLAKQDRIQATLMILQIPVLILLGAFLFMISGQMYDMERNEISVIKSRGSSGAQIFRLYLYQSIFLTVTGAALGIPLGVLFSRILGSAKNFMEFDGSRVLQITFTLTVWIYAAVAMGITLLIMTLPAVKHSRVTIVNLKQQKAMKKKSWWEKIFLDIIVLGISVYGYYSFHKNYNDLGQSVLMGESLDPLLYISSSLFILGLGLLFLRLQPYLVQLIYFVGKRFWKPASYASFMENLKNGRKQQFIMLFLIMTISLGMYHATVARTILQNARENAEYLDGADIIIREVWKEVTDSHGQPTGIYIEPDYTKYASMEAAAGYTRVLYDDQVYIGGTGGTPHQDITLMGVHTKEFGSVTWVSRDLTEKHYYEYLNDLAMAENGVLVSENFRTKLGYDVGDTITYYGPKNKSADGKIVGFFEYWPGYVSSFSSLDAEGNAFTEDNYLLVAHYDGLRQKWGLQPYEIWIKLQDGYDSQDIYDWIQSVDAHVAKYVDKPRDLKSAEEDPLLQGTNGVLTMGFLVTLLLCAVGYLIYWIMSIRSREMIFGVLRASGMHKGELFHMLMNEQIFSGVFSVLVGIGIGKLTSVMFVPMLQQAYAATNQALPMKLVTDSADMIRLYGVIAAVMIICLAVLILLLFKLNVTKALKLGEE